jgi:hypothetical protein
VERLRAFVILPTLNVVLGLFRLYATQHLGTHAAHIQETALFVIAIYIDIVSFLRENRPAMSKRIVLCTDGTWDNTANNTNAYKVSKSLTTSADQVGFYDDGVGVNGAPIEQLIGGAFGTGLFQKVKDGYTQVAHLYEQDDPIFLFGFSRGAYTARSIAA